MGVPSPAGFERIGAIMRGPLTLALAASLAALIATPALAQGTGQGQAAGGNGAGQSVAPAPKFKPMRDAEHWSSVPKAELDAERERRHTKTQAAVAAAGAKAFLLQAAACDNSPGYDQAKAEYDKAYDAVRRAASAEAGLDPGVLKPWRAWEAALNAYMKLKEASPPANEAILDRALDDVAARQTAYQEAETRVVDSILAGAAGDGVVPPTDKCFKPQSKPKVAEQAPAQSGTPQAAPNQPYTETKVETPILPKAEVFTPKDNTPKRETPTDSLGMWLGKPPSVIAHELAGRHAATAAAYAGAVGDLAQVNAIGCGGPADSLDAALSDYDAAYSHAQQAVAHEAALDRTVLASARAGAGTDAAFDAAVRRIAATHKPLPDPGGICPSARIAETLPPPPPPIGGQTGPAIVDGMRPADREPTTRIQTELPNPVAHHGGCAGGGGYMPPPPPPPAPPPPPP
jgi:tetratricopeptide (TPR) repeat protein